MNDPLPDEWQKLERAHAASLELELQREVCARHVLWRKPCTALARRIPFDDVLFAVTGAKHPYYAVHLTYAVEQDPTWPFTRAFTSLADFAENWQRAYEEDDPQDDWRTEHTGPG